MRQLPVSGPLSPTAAGGENLEVAVGQVHAAVGVLLPSWWRAARASPMLNEHAAHVIQHWQQRNAATRQSHRKRTLKKIQNIGVVLKNLVRCRWT